MNESPDLMLVDRFRRLANPVNDSDWFDVQRRARRMPVRRRGRVWALAAAAVIAGVAVAAPAFGLGSKVLGLFTGEPAPPAVKEAVARVDRDAPPGMGPNVAAAQTRKLMQLELSNGERAVLWIAPMRSGGICVYVQRSQEPAGGGPGCEPAVGSGAAISWTLQGPPERGAPIVLLFGRVNVPGALRIELLFEDGRTTSAATEQGFFLIEIPSSQYAVGHRVVSLRAQDSGGEVLATTRVIAGFGIYPNDQRRP